MQRTWQWEEGSKLIPMSPYTPAREMFDAVCREINRYYSDKENFKAFKKKIRWKGTYLSCELCFWSSHSNISGQYVAFEIVSHVWANNKADNKKLGLNYLVIRPRTYDVHDIGVNRFFEIIDYMDERFEFVRSIDTPHGFMEFIDYNTTEEAYKAHDLLVFNEFRSILIRE